MNIFPKQAMLLAAGQGTRMLPLTEKMPKPMIEVAGRTLIDRAIDNLLAAGIEKIVVNTSYRALVLEEHLRQRTDIPHLVFSREREPLETGGGITKALSHFEDKPFFSINGDVIWLDNGTSALNKLAKNLTDTVDAVLLLHKTDKVIGYAGHGDFFCDPTGKIKRKKEEEKAPYIYTGLQIFRPQFFANCIEEAFSLNLLYNRSIAMSPPRIKGVMHTGELIHVSDPGSLKMAEDYFASASSLNVEN